MKNCVGEMVVIAVSTILWQWLECCDYAVSIVSLLNSERVLTTWRSISGLSFVYMHIQSSIFQFYTSLACVYRSAWCGKTGELCWEHYRVNESSNPCLPPL